MRKEHDMLKSHRRAGRIYSGFFSICIMLSFTSPSAFSQGDLNLPTLPAPEEYGDVAIDRTSTAKNVIPVIFSHWVHRAKYTCRVCHGELEFSMKVNETAILCRNGEKDGKYCTVCHDGKISFAPKDEKGENCKLCHNANTGPDRDKFFALQRKLPRSKWGNEI
ncbi:MAG TPA: c(7)-type cytochrome triheme domain-containing protein, partial [Thermoguttaceae bacterium]